MKLPLINIIAISLFALVISGQEGDAQVKGDIPDGYSRRLDTDRFVLLWNEASTSEDEIREVDNYADRMWFQLRDVLGKEHMPEEKLIISFGGDAYDPVTRKKWTSLVDYQGRIHLRRYPQMGYFGTVLHEMIHAVRKNVVPAWDGFFEEGLASALTYYLEPETEEYSRFGYPMEVLAGYWFDTKSNIPMKLMQERHYELNRKCGIQTYAQREDFFTYLIRLYGMEKLIAFANSSEIGQLALYQKTWGKSFDQLIADWKNDLMTRYHDYPGARSLAEEYLKETPAKYWKVCKKELDY